VAEVAVGARSFPHFRRAARALFAVENLSEKEGQFVGGLAFRSAPLSEKQANWLRILLHRHELPPLDPSGDE
jgi:hypothetical protein